MVLQDLAEKLIGGMKKLAAAKTIDDAFFKSFMIEVSKALIAADVSTPTVFALSKKIKERVDLKNIPPGLSAKKVIEKAVFEELVALISPGREPYAPKKKTLNIFMMVGLQGAGKTTTVAKLGNYYRRRNWKTAVIAADTFRAGAREQLMQNAQTAHLPYYVDFTESDPVKVALAGVEKFRAEKFEIVIIDTSGRHMQEQALFDEMKSLDAAIHPDEIIFVLDGTIGQGAFNQAKAFKEAVGVGSIIVTKLDSNAKGGGAISAIAATGSPISFFGSGETFSDLEYFDPKSFISRLLGISDPLAFQRTMEEIDQEKNKEVSEHIQNRKFSFRDMYNQYSSILDVGNFNSMIESIGNSRGMPQNANTPEQTKETVKRILTVIDSMGEDELENPDLFRDEKRKIRLCAGCGLPPFVVQHVIDEQRRWEQMIKKMDPLTIRILTQQEKPSFANERQFREQIQKMAKAMGPQMLMQLGGIEGLEASMRQSWEGPNAKKN